MRSVTRTKDDDSSGHFAYDGLERVFHEITDEGRLRFLEYITVLENVVGDALAAAKAVPAPGESLSEGWSPA